MVTNKEARKMYRQFNKKYFRNKLPRKVIICFKDLKRSGWAYTHFENMKPHSIILNTRFRWSRSGIEMTLLHEMVHVKLPYRCDSHGPYSRFEKEMRRLAKAGAFTESW